MSKTKFTGTANPPDLRHHNRGGNWIKSNRKKAYREALGHNRERNLKRHARNYRFSNSNI